VELKATSVVIETPDDYELYSVFFQYADGYLTMCRGEEDEIDEEMYIEKDDQGWGTYVVPESLKYSLTRDTLDLTLGDEVAKEMNTDTHIKVRFEVDDDDFETMSQILEKIFG